MSWNLVYKIKKSFFILIDDKASYFLVFKILIGNCQEKAKKEIFKHEKFTLTTEQLPIE